uniref:Takeout-like protein 2 n=1 Tax=Epiphyas postvittana TaxID=65032 RepID=B5ABT2_EPIPO|nr:takeout-like protein 2 [Epiphyas postvittana]
MLFFLIGAVVCSVASGQLAPFITPCRQADSACHLSSANRAAPILAAGVPQLGLASLDPMRVGRVASNQAGLDLEMTDTTVKGLGKCVVLNVRRTGKKTSLELKCPTVLVTGDYKLGGKLLILPIEGNGKYKIKIRDIIVKIQYETAEEERGGEKYWRVINWKHTTDVQTNVQYQFQNLFNGNKQAADSIHQFANSNWKEIYHEVAPPVVKAIIGNVVKEIEKLFQKVPINQLSLD